VSHSPVDPALLSPVQGADPLARTAAPASDRSRVARVEGPSFGEVLATRAAGVQFSGHALQRIERRGIELGPHTLMRLQEGVERAAGKGARESVVLVDGTAFVVSVANRTVITAVDPGHMRDHVFTNIDSAVIA
jgi:flagellar operon protein